MLHYSSNCQSNYCRSLRQIWKFAEFVLLCLSAIIVFHSHYSVRAFSSQHLSASPFVRSSVSSKPTMQSSDAAIAAASRAEPSTLPGDPSLLLTTNVNLGGKKLQVMKAISKTMSSHTGKPESYIAVSILDNADVIFGGTDDPAALACMYSIGAIAMESNGRITNDVTELLEPYGISGDRVYINFFDVPRPNVGWNKKTFAG